MIKDRTRINILFSCTGEAKKDFDPFVQDHVVVFVLNGRMTINDGKESLDFKTGDIGFISKNQLLKTQKIPLDNTPFYSVSVFLPKETLYNYSKQYNISPQGQNIGKSNFLFSEDTVHKEYVTSMVPYVKHINSYLENFDTIK